jgi:hypothetical protein
MTANERELQLPTKKEMFQANGNTKENARELLASEIQLWENNLKVRGKDVNIVSRDESIRMHNRVNWSARCTIVYSLSRE